MAVVSSTLLAMAVVACDRPSAPDDSGLQKSTGSGTDTAGTGGLINPPPPPGNPVDTSGSSTYSGPVRLTVLVWSGVRSTHNGIDTLNVTPLAGAKVEVEGILQLAQSAQSGMTDSEGQFVVSGLPVGPYRVRITPPASSGIAPVTGQSVLDRENVTMPFTLFRN